MKNFRYAAMAALLLSLCACVRLPVNTSAADALSAEEHFKLAAIYESKGELESALKEYESAVKKDNKPDAHFAAANIYLRMKKYKEAEARYLKAIELDPSKGGYYNNLGWLYMETGELERAEAEVNEALKKDPRRGYIYLDTLGVIQLKQGKFPEAEKTLNKASVETPPEEKNGLLEIYNHLLELYLKTGDKGKAALIQDKIKNP